MYKIPAVPSREEVFEYLSKSVSFGNLGLFIGAGFSKAVINYDSTESALSWVDLLKVCAEKMDINFENDIYTDGVSYPQIATSLCEVHSSKKAVDYEESVKFLKRQICDLTSLYPTKEKREEYSGYLEIFEPSWIITTNYDLVIESLLTGKSSTLSPKDQLIAASDIIPVFHLHGVRTNPDDLIITQEDYISLFRPNEYRQIKLALTIKESTVLLLGYSLGDVNVLTAIDWSKNVFDGQQSNYPHEVIQVLREKKPKAEPYRTKNGIIIIETDDLINFFKEFTEIRTKCIEAETKELTDLQTLSKTLKRSDPSDVEAFIDDDDYRKGIVEKLCESPNYLISAFELFLTNCINTTWVRSAPRGAFKGYAQNLILILDILQPFSLDTMPPALFEVLADALNKLAWYIGDNPGESHAAAGIWRARKPDLPEDTIKELHNFSVLREANNLRWLLDFA